MEPIELYKTKIGTIATLFVIIEESFNDDFSILAFDDDGQIFIEKFAPTIEKAKEIGKKLYNKIIKKYNHESIN